MYIVEKVLDKVRNFNKRAYIKIKFYTVHRIIGRNINFVNVD